MSTIVDEMTQDTGITVIAFSEQQLEEALHTIYTMHDRRQNFDNQGGQKQQQNNHERNGPKIGPRPPTRLETGIRLFGKVPATKVVEFFIALLERATRADAAAHSRGDGPRTTIFGDGLGVEHVLVQSFFIWLNFAEKRYRNGLTPKMTTTTAATASSSRSSAKVRRENDDCDGFRPTTRTPSPPRKGGGGRKHRQRAVAGEQPKQQKAANEAPEFEKDDEQQQSLVLDAMSDKLRKILQANEHDEGQKEHQAVQGEERQQPQRVEQKRTNNDAVKNEKEEGDGSQQIIANFGTDGNSASVSPPSVCLHRVLITSSHRDQLVSLLAPFCFASRGNHSNIWKTVVSVLELKHVTHLARFVVIVKESVHQGRIGFDLLCFCLQNFADQMQFTAHHLVHALLLGPLCAVTVEQFVANQSEEFRAQTRAVLLEAYSWKFDENKWRDASVTYAHRSYEQMPDFKEFCANVTTLMKDLKNEISDQDNLVDPRWAHSLIKTAARKLYTERTWKVEHFNDLVHTVLVQRPTLKAFLLNVLLKDHHDKRAHEKWRNFVSSERYRMSNEFDMVNLCSKNEQRHFLSLPRSCAVYEIDTVHAFRVFERQLDEYFLKKKHPVVVGVDAEWNPYVAKSRANLLQLALIHSVYLLDLDALHADKSFQLFIDRLFLNKTVIKLGYQFGDDLAMLRARLPACIGLYRPQGIVCIGQLIDELNRRSVPLLPAFPLDKFVLPLTDQQEEELKDHTRQIKPQRYDAAGTNNKNKLPVMNPLNDMVTVPHQQQQKATSSNCYAYDPYDDEVDLFSGHDAQGKTRRLSKKSQVPTNVAGPGKSLADQGLAYLCRRVLGKPLDKQEQCSVWDRRPLRRRQVRYAALDAHCLMQIHHRCAQWSEQLGLGGDPIALMPSSAILQKYCAPLPLFCTFSMPNELLLPTTNAIDGNVWGNELDEPEGWKGN